MKPTKTPSKSKKPAAKAPAKKTAPKAVKKAPAKKAAPVKKAPVKKPVAAPKKPAAKKAAPFSAPGNKKTPAAPAKPKAKAVRSDKPIAPNRNTKNGIVHPGPGTVAAELWATADALKAKLNRAPARFEFRENIVKLNEAKAKKSAPLLSQNTASFQFFLWRSYNGIKPREAGIFPKRNSFEASTPRTSKKAAVAAPKPAKAPAKVKPAAKKAEVKKPVAKKPAPAPKAAPKAPAKPTTKKAPAAKKPAAKKTPAAKVEAPQAELPLTPAAPTPEPPKFQVAGVSSRLAAASAAAATKA